VKMEDAPVDWTAVHDQSPSLFAPIPRSSSPTRVLATQSQVNVVVKVDGESIEASAPAQATKKRRRDSDEDVSDAVPEELAAVFLKRPALDDQLCGA